jgi:internalin A
LSVLPHFEPCRIEAELTSPSKHIWHPWLSHLRFSVRGLIVLVLVIGGGLGWLVPMAREARVQRVAVEAIKQSGGDVKYDRGWTHGQSSWNGASWYPAWLVDLLGVDYFGSVTVVVIGGRGSDQDMAFVRHLNELEGLMVAGPYVTDTGINQLIGLNRLEWLTLADTSLSDASLSHLRELPGLQRLGLCHIKVTDNGMPYLAAIHGLKVLHLDNTDVSDAGLAHLNALPNLRHLFLEGQKFTDLGLKHLAELKRLQRLYLARTNITDAGMAYVKGLSGLEDLSLDGTKVTDAGLAEVKCLTNLQVMSLANTNVSDAGLEHLKGLSKLQILDVKNTKVTQAGSQELRKALPKLKISRY